VSGEWYPVQRGPGFFDIQRNVDSPRAIAVQFANVDAVYGVGGVRVDLARASEATATIAANQGLTVLGISGSQLDGRDGFVVEVENTSDTATPVLHVRGAGPVVIDPGRSLWIGFFDTGDGVLAIMVGGSAEQWEEALLAAEPILETITIDG
jgi:hypothetical protein